MCAARPLVAAVLLLATLPARAAELLLGWDTRGVWTSNVFRSESDEEDAVSFLNGPNLGLRQAQGDVRYDVRYSPRYELFVDLDDANALEHFLVATGSWSIDRRTEVTLQNHFSRSRGLREVFEPAEVDLEEGEVFTDREARLRNAASGSVSYRLSPRTSLALNLTQTLYDYESEDRGDATSYRGSLSLRRALTRRQSTGFGVSASRYDTDETDFQEGRGTSIFETFGIYDLVLSRSLRFAISAGPAWVMPDDFDLEDERFAVQYPTTRVEQELLPGVVVGRASLADRSSCLDEDPASCQTPAAAFVRATNEPAAIPGFDPGVAPVSALPIAALPVTGTTPSVDSSLNLFGNVSLTYARKPFSWSLAYTRRAINSSGTGTTTDLDSVRASAGWEAARRWRLGARASWQRQSSLSEVPSPIVILADDGATVLLDANGLPVTDPALAVFEVRDVAQNGAVRFDTDDSSLEITSYNFSLSSSYALSRRLELRALASYWYQTSEGDQVVETDRESLRFELGFTWSFDPISL